MYSYQRKILAVIGAGPKGLAVAVKAKVLEEFGFAVDRVILIEKDNVAAHWSGDFGYTNGEMKLGTAPEKDLIFPLEIDVGNSTLNARIQKRLLDFSWTSFLIYTDQYSDWIDRGRHTPSHKIWACYLQWIAEQLAPEIIIIKSEVTQVDLTADGKRWKLMLKDTTHVQRLQFADRLMMTGPGKTRMDFIEHPTSYLPPGTYDLESFWQAIKNKIFTPKGTLAIIGAGENAASVLLALSQYAPQLQIDVISPKGLLFTRAENYCENQFFSHPEKKGWGDMNIDDRLEFIKRTDLGVISQHAMNILNEQIGHRIIPGRVVNLKYENQRIQLNLNYQKIITTHTYDQVVLATGFDQVALLKTLFTPTAQKALEHALSAPLNQQILTSHIQADLAVKNMRPHLHLPMLAGLMQGPGFANLSCLGLLSDRVVTRFMRRSAQNTNHIYFYPLELSR